MTVATQLLIVDDTESVCNLFGRALEASGFGCTLSYSGAEGWRVLEARRVDVVLCDLQLSDMTGLDFLRRLRASQWRETPFGLFSAGVCGTDEALEIDALGVPFACAVVHPLTIVRLARMLATIDSRAKPGHFGSEVKT